MVRGDVDDGDKTLVPEMLKNAGTLTTKMSTLTEELNTMVINSDDTDDEATMKSKCSDIIIFVFLLPLYSFVIIRYVVFFQGHDTGSADYGKKYRPPFMDHFDKKESENNYSVSVKFIKKKL